MAEILPVQWFPGHMAKTRRLMQENLRLVDLVVELAAGGTDTVTSTIPKVAATRSWTACWAGDPGCCC